MDWGKVALELAKLAQYSGLIEAAVLLVETGRLTEGAALKALNDAATAASDAEMAREFPNG